MKKAVQKRRCILKGRCPTQQSLLLPFFGWHLFVTCRVWRSEYFCYHFSESRWSGPDGERGSCPPHSPCCFQPPHHLPPAGVPVLGRLILCMWWGHLFPDVLLLANPSPPEDWPGRSSACLCRCLVQFPLWIQSFRLPGFWMPEISGWFKIW